MGVRYQFRNEKCAAASSYRIRMDEYTANQLQRSISYWGDYEKEVYSNGSSQEMVYLPVPDGHCQLP